LPAGEPILIGLSGGGDSVALLVRLSALAGGRRLVAGIVDHGLRAGSADDARQAADIARDAGAQPHILTLHWPDGPRAGQAAARVARYRALAELARAVGASTLFLGHTSDDQAETVFMRRAAGSGPRGLAGMAPLAPCPVWPEGRDLWLARPLLGETRSALRSGLAAAGAGWIEDPSNRLVRYARVCARAALATGGAEALLREARDAAAAAEEEDRAALAFLGAAVLGDACADLPPADPGNPAHARALAVVATAYGGARREPPPAAAQGLARRLADTGGATLAGARFRYGGVSRDPGGLRGRRGGVAGIGSVPLPAGRPVVWDNRLVLTAVADSIANPPRPGEDGPLVDGPAMAAWLPARRVVRLLHRGA
jgi:tRNA(Ile)-lysidine synthase